MKKVIFAAIFAAFLSNANAQSYMDEIDMMKVSERPHPMSQFHTVCVFKPQFGNGGSIRITVEGFCPLYIRYNIVSNTWHE